MENKLTQYPYYADNVFRRSMDEIKEQDSVAERVTKATDKKAEETPRLTEAQLKVKRAWDEVVKKKIDKGEEVTDQENELMRRAIERGEMPRVVAGGSGDGKYENFPADKYEGKSLESTAKRLKEAGENNRVTGEFLKDLSEEINQLVALGRVTEDEQQEFINDAGVIAQSRREGNEAGRTIQDIIQARIGRAKEKKEGRSSNPRSIQELAAAIILDEGGDRWGPGGRFPLLEQYTDRNGDPQVRIVKDNFMKWFRERMMYQHLNNSRDSKLQMGNLVGIESDYGSRISIFKMDEARAQYFRDEVTNEIYDDMADQMKTELWLFGNMRNYDLMYQDAMGSDSELPKLVAGIHSLEEITRPGSLKTIMTMSKDYQKRVVKRDENGNVIGEEEVTDTAIGDGVRKAYEIYFNISDIDELERIVGKDSIFFKKEGFVKAFQILEKKQANDTGLSPDATKFIEKLFPNGVLDKSAFIEEMNPFNNQNKPEFNKEIVREMVRLVIADKYGFEYGLHKSIEKTRDTVTGNLVAPERDFLRKDLEYAETWAWILTRWTGAGARNDTGAIGFDAMTKAIKVRDYRLRQSSASRAGAFGNEYDVPVFKSLVSDFFNGIYVEKKAEDKGKNLTPYEIFRMLDQVEDDPNLTDEEKKEKKDSLAKKLNFEQFTQKAFYANHLDRGFQVFHSLMGAEEMKLEEVVKWDPFRGVILDRGKFEEQVKDKFLKPMRYEFSTYAQLDFGKTTRIQVGIDKNTKLPIYKEVTNAEKFFGPKVLEDLRPKAIQKYKNEIKSKKMTEEQAWSAYLSSDKEDGGRRQLWKRAAMARIAAHIKSHRQFGNGYAPFSAGMVDTFYDALSSIKQVEIDEDEEGLSYSKSFFTKEELDWIRRESGTTRTRLFMQDVVLKAGGTGALKGSWEGAKMFVSDIFK